MKRPSETAGGAVRPGKMMHYRIVPCNDYPTKWHIMQDTCNPADIWSSRFLAAVPTEEIAIRIVAALKLLDGTVAALKLIDATMGGDR